MKKIVIHNEMELYKYVTNVSPYGGVCINVEAPTKKECIELYRVVAGQKVKKPIDEALR